MNEETQNELREQFSYFITDFMTEQKLKIPSDSNFILDNEFEELYTKLEEYILSVHKTALEEEEE